MRYVRIYFFSLIMPTELYREPITKDRTSLNHTSSSLPIKLSLSLSQHEKGLHSVNA